MSEEEPLESHNRQECFRLLFFLQGTKSAKKLSIPIANRLNKIRIRKELRKKTHTDLSPSVIIAIEIPEPIDIGGQECFLEGEENFVGDSEIIALGGASNETKDRPLG